MAVGAFSNLRRGDVQHALELAESLKGDPILRSLPRLFFSCALDAYIDSNAEEAYCYVANGFAVQDRYPSDEPNAASWRGVSTSDVLRMVDPISSDGVVALGYLLAALLPGCHCPMLGMARGAEAATCDVIQDGAAA